MRTIIVMITLFTRPYALRYEGLGDAVVETTWDMLLEAFVILLTPAVNVRLVVDPEMSISKYERVDLDFDVTWQAEER